MRRKTFAEAERKSLEISNRVLSADFRVTPAMRQKVGDLAVWLAGGDPSKVGRATQAVIGLLCETARVPRTRFELLDPLP